MEKRTPLYDCHVEQGGKMVEFAGYMLPVQYTEVIEEHMAVRERAGLFDVSHMGEFIISGKDALANLNNLFTNDFTGMADGRVRYSPLCNEEGGIVDDLTVYRFSEEKYMVVPNAANRDKDAAHIRKFLFGEVTMEDISNDVAQIALQGPKAKGIIAKLADATSIPTKYYTFVENGIVAGVKCIVSRTGYTGEHGYELYCAAADAQTLWRALLEAGKDDGLVPCGLGARDTLRLEAAMPLYGHEMTDDITPLETSLHFAVKMDKESFIGKKAIEAKGEPQIIRVGLKVVGRGIAREHNAVFADGKKIGETTSGTYCPFLGEACAMALVDVKHSAIDSEVEVEVRGRKLKAKVVALPFYKKS